MLIYRIVKRLPSFKERKINYIIGENKDTYVKSTHTNTTSPIIIILSGMLQEN
jgi:hypothetical protein